MNRHPFDSGCSSCPSLASAVIYLAGRVSVRLGAGAAPARWLALLALAATGVPLWQVGASGVWPAVPCTLSVGAITLVMDGVGLVLAVTVLVLTFLVAVFSIPYMARRGRRREVLRAARRDGRRR